MPGNLNLCLRKTLAGKSHYNRDVIVFKQLRFKKRYLPYLEHKAYIFKFVRCEQEELRKAAFSRRISVDGGLSCRNKASRSNFSGIV